MTAIRQVMGKLIGLLVDDGVLALQVLGLVAAVGLAVKGAGLAPLAGAGLLLAGTLAILALSLRRKLRG